MTAIKTMTAGMIVWGALGTFAQGAPMSWYGGSSPWPTWYANQLQGNSQAASSGVGNYYLGGTANNVWWLNSPAQMAGPERLCNGSHFLHLHAAGRRLHQLRYRPLPGNKHPDHRQPSSLV